MTSAENLILTMENDLTPTETELNIKSVRVNTLLSKYGLEPPLAQERSLK